MPGKGTATGTPLRPPKAISKVAKRCAGPESSAHFCGRILRGPFWLIYLILFAVTAALGLFIESKTTNNPVLAILVLILLVWIAICVTVKRLHDIDASGWLSIPVVLIPIALILVGSFLGTVGPNQYGHDPLERPSN
jgi:uncharacterized membrane protein YhaH (DUF805 family)